MAQTYAVTKCKQRTNSLIVSLVMPINDYRAFVLKTAIAGAGTDEVCCCYCLLVLFALLFDVDIKLRTHLLMYLRMPLSKKSPI